MRSIGRESGTQFQVRWQPAVGEREQRVDYPYYAHAEACFISLFSVVDRSRGGWAELWSGERCVLGMGPDAVQEEADDDEEEEGREGTRAVPSLNLC